jgi:hypothetical protein
MKSVWILSPLSPWSTCDMSYISKVIGIWILSTITLEHMTYISKVIGIWILSTITLEHMTYISKVTEIWILSQLSP